MNGFFVTVIPRALRRVLPLILVLGGAVTSLAFSSARGAPLDAVSYDFLSRQITVYGLYVPKPEEAKGGLAAELEARQNGIAVLGAHLDKACEGGSENPRLSSAWKTSLRSQGSEIYANGVLKIILTASLKEVYKEFGSPKIKGFKTPEGEAIAFRLPSLPQSAIGCGTVKVEILGKKYSAAPIAVSRDESVKRVNLLLGGGGVLRVGSPEDGALLEKSKFFEEALTESEILILPVVGG